MCNCVLKKQWESLEEGWNSLEIWSILVGGVGNKKNVKKDV